MKHILILALLTTIFSCTQKESYLLIEDDKVIYAIWKRTDIKKTYADKEHEEASKKAFKGTYKNFYANVFPDGTGSFLYSTKMDTFTWKEKRGNSSDGAAVDSYAATSFEGSELRLLTIKGDTCLEVSTDGGYTKMYFKKHAELTNNYLEDPFHNINNRWRIASTGRISDEAVKAKVINYLTHYKYLFKAAVDSDNRRTFSNRNSQGLLKVYKSAIGIVPENKISQDWYSYYDGKNEVLFSYDILKEKISSKANKIKKTDDWIADNYQILTNILDTEQ